MSPSGLGPFLRNVRLVARREYRVRVRSRAFVLSTLLLAAVAAGTGLVPILVRALDREAVVRLAVHADDAALQALAIRSLDTVLNGRTQLDPTAKQAWAIEPAADVPAARARVVRGDLAGLLLVGRDAVGTPSFEYVTNAPPGGRHNAARTTRIGYSATHENALGAIRPANKPPTMPPNDSAT